MAKIKIDIDDHAVRQALTGLEDRADDLRPAFQEIGETLLLSTEDRFRDEVDPDGQPWVDVLPRTRARKRNPKILTEDAHLRGRMVWQLVDGGVEIGTDVPYANVHQFGFEARHIPSRPFLGISDEDRDVVREVLQRWVAG